MDAEQYLDSISEPRDWYALAAALRRSGDALWHGYRTSSDPAEAMDFLTTSMMVYGLAIETALKAKILGADSVDVDVRIQLDDDGTAEAASMRFRGDAHNLEHLALQAGVVDKNGDQTIRKILRNLTECVKWVGRYPVRKKVSRHKQRSAKVPVIYKNVSIREYIDRFLNDLLGQTAD